MGIQDGPKIVEQILVQWEGIAPKEAIWQTLSDLTTKSWLKEEGMIQLHKYI